MPGGRDAKTLRGRPNPVRVDDYGRNGSPNYPARLSADEIDRSGVKTWASSRTGHYDGRGPSWAAGGPPPDGKSRAPRNYTDPGRMT